MNDKDKLIREKREVNRNLKILESQYKEVIFIDFIVGFDLKFKLYLYLQYANGTVY